MKVIVTGGAGFIGSHLCEKLILENCEICVIDNLSTGRLENINHISKKINFIDADVSKAGKWQNKFENVDWVIHLAALADIVPSIQNPKNYFKSNVVGTYNVLQAALDHKVKKLIYSASSSCYGIPNIYPTPEDAIIQPQYPYALTKRLAEELVLHWAKVYDLPAISLRFFNVYGTRSRTSGTYGAVFGVFLAQKLSNQPLTIVGDGKQTRDFTYVTDVVESIVCALKSGYKNEVFNVGSDNTVSINKIAKLIGGKTINIPKRPGEPEVTFANIQKIKNLLNWSPKINIEKGVEKVISDIKYWENAPVWTPKKIEIATKDWFKFLK